ncbi:MAG: succinate dehydrogenase cytochrome b subunit [Candidatus Scalindua sp.]|nr:succinate dehydrogenase cytochrome b subunit [Candidatus Scalindua sp.]MCR4343646.1 succinate dehydrogenase cytochrome b subunit [Candidatus Scalindua sp.]
MHWKSNRFILILSSSIGKKSIMAVTGLGFCVFLISHLAGNLIIYAGKDSFNSYAERLHSLGSLLILAEIGLFCLGIVHISTGVYLFYQNFRARPERYKKKKNAGGRTISSSTMPYTGFLILIFIVFHLMDFHFVEKADSSIYQIVLETFSNPGYTIFYILSMVVVATHVDHGFWSLLHTLGITNLECMPVLRVISSAISLFVGIGFGSLPVFITLIS